MQRGTRVRVAVLAGALAAGALANVVLASAEDGAGALLTNAAQKAGYAATPQSPNVTCDITAGGRDVNQRTTYGIGEVYGQDAGFGQGECASLTDKTFDCTVTVWLEYYVRSGVLAGTYQPIPGTTRSTFGSAREGVCTPPLPPNVTKTYAGGSPYLNTYHQAHARITNTLPGSVARDDVSPVWFMVP